MYYLHAVPSYRQIRDAYLLNSDKCIVAKHMNRKYGWYVYDGELPRFDPLERLHFDVLRVPTSDVVLFMLSRRLLTYEKYVQRLKESMHFELYDPRMT